MKLENRRVYELSVKADRYNTKQELKRTFSMLSDVMGKLGGETLSIEQTGHETIEMNMILPKLKSMAETAESVPLPNPLINVGITNNILKRSLESIYEKAIADKESDELTIILTKQQ